MNEASPSRAAGQPQKAYVLDTSAITALIENEAGAEKIEKILRNEPVLLPFVVMLEVYYITLQEVNEQEADAQYAKLKALKVTYLWEMNEPTLLTAARFKGRYSISLADSMIAAFALTIAPSWFTKTLNSKRSRAKSIRKSFHTEESTLVRRARGLWSRTEWSNLGPAV